MAILTWELSHGSLSASYVFTHHLILLIYCYSNNFLAVFCLIHIIFFCYQ